MVFYDLGIPLALLYAAAWGAALGVWYRQFVRGEGLGACMYPAVFISLLEIFRILYFGNPRGFPVLLMILVGYFVFGRRHRVVGSTASAPMPQPRPDAVPMAPDRKAA